MNDVDQNPRDIQAIHQLKARYFRFMDTKRWADLRSVFTEDACFIGATGDLRGADAFVRRVQERLQNAATVHQGHMPEVTLTALDEARGIWAMFDWVEFPEPLKEGPGKGYRGFIGYGHYEEEYRKGTDGQWRIASLRMNRIRLNPVVGPQQIGLDVFFPPSKWDKAARVGLFHMKGAGE